MKLHVVMRDITTMQVDAIVNAANTSLLGGGGVDGAIHRKAGPELLAECRTLHGCATGQAKITKRYRLPCTYVIHTPGPVWQGGTQQEDALLAGCYQSCMELAKQYCLHTLAFPAISTGIYGLPLKRACRIALHVLRQYEQDACITDVYLVCFDTKTYETYQEVFKEQG